MKKIQNGCNLYFYVSDCIYGSMHFICYSDIVSDEGFMETDPELHDLVYGNAVSYYVQFYDVERCNVWWSGSCPMSGKFQPPSYNSRGDGWNMSHPESVL